MRLPLSFLVLSLTALSVSGCASVWSGTSRSYSVSPSGLPWGEELVRRSLVMGTFDQALARTTEGRDGAPNDDLLRALFHGQAAFYAGRWDESATAFAEADRLTEQRATKSASRSVLSVLTNDHALRYVPPRTEQLFSRYYAMLGRVQSGDVEGAAVEARRLSALLETLRADLDASERATHAALRDVSGAVFELAGEWNDAGVAYRNAALLRGTSRDSIDSIVVSRPAGDSATLLLVVESGFVAHYVAQTFAIPMDAELPSNRSDRSARVQRSAERGASPETLGRIFGLPKHATEQNTLSDSRDAVDEARRIASDAIPTSAPPVYVVSPHDTGAVTALTARPALIRSTATSASSRWLAALDALPDGGVFLSESGVDDLSGAVGSSSRGETVAADWTPHRLGGTRYLGDRRGIQSWLEVAWPSLVRPRLPSAPLSLRLQGVVPVDSTATANASARDGRWVRAVDIPNRGITTADISDAVGADARRGRLARLARLSTRAATRAVAVEAVREKHGEAAGLVTSFLVSAIERADTRGWHLLPGRVAVVRVTVPAGLVEPSLLIGAAVNGTASALSAFEARPGTVHVFSTRVWRDPAGTGPATIATNQRRDDGAP